MPRTPATVRQADISRALRATMQVNIKMAVEILPNGSIRLIPINQLPGVEMKKNEIVCDKVRPIL
jgi:hypothetical protein